MPAAIGGIIRERLRNQPNGFAGLNSSGDLLGTLINRHMTYAELIAGVIPEIGEIVYCTDTRDVHVGDGSTVGGVFLYSPRKEVATQNLNSQTVDGSTKTIATWDAKANCEYVLQANIGITDVAPNNCRISFKSPDLISQIGNSAGGSSWEGGTSPNSILPARFSSGGYLTLDVSGVSALWIFQRLTHSMGMLHSVDATFDVTYKQIIANAGPVIITECNISVQRVA